MFNKALSRMFFIAAVLLALTCVSCLERTEEITVDEDGTTTIVAQFVGGVGDFRPPIALPSAPEWTILKSKIDSSDTSHIRMELEAELTVPNGTPLPQTYAQQDAVGKNVNLLFPSEVRHWTEGKRTFYEFKRTYIARSYGCYNITEGVLWNQDLEDRVLEKGIFEASEPDRTEYLEQFVSAFRYLHWRFLWETLGMLVQRGEITISAKKTVQEWAGHYLESVVTPVRILGILGKEDDSIGVALDSLSHELHYQFAGFFPTVLESDDVDVQESFKNLFHTVTLGYDVTEALDSHQFSVSLTLPGVVIEANGFVDPEKPGVVEWYFKGKDLHDRDIRLNALSVVEH